MHQHFVGDLAGDGLREESKVLPNMLYSLMILSATSFTVPTISEPAGDPHLFELLARAWGPSTVPAYAVHHLKLYVGNRIHRQPGPSYLLYTYAG